MKRRNFEINEKKGMLPYVVMWIGAHKLPSIEHYNDLEIAMSKVIYLKSLKREPTLLIDFNQCKII